MIRLPRVESLGLAGVGFVVLVSVGAVFAGDPGLPVEGAELPPAEFVVAAPVTAAAAVAVRCPDPYTPEDECPATTSPETSSTPPPSASVPSSAPTTTAVAVTSTSLSTASLPPVPTVPPAPSTPPSSVGIGEPVAATYPPQPSVVSVAPPPIPDSPAGSTRSPVPERLSNGSPAPAEPAGEQIPATGARFVIVLVIAGWFVAGGVVCLLLAAVFADRRPS